jgi:hypothetical protein
MKRGRLGGVAVGTALAFALLTGVAGAHTANEKTLYDDIETSKAVEQIVLLRGLGVIGQPEGVKLYRPQEKLTKAELKEWASGFTGTSPVAGDGNATYGDVNQAFFGGKAQVEQAERELTKEEFALFMGQFLTEKVDGKTLFERAGMTKGPSGVVEAVVEETEGQGEKAYHVYRLKLGGQEYPVAAHPKLLHLPTDLKLVKGKAIRETWVKDGKLQILVADQGTFRDEMSMEQRHGHDKAGHEHDRAEQEGDFPWVPIGGGAVLVLLLWWLFGKRGH